MRKTDKSIYIGKTYGYLTVVDIYNKKYAFAICRCKCGNRKDVRLSSLLCYNNEQRGNFCKQCYKGILLSSFIGKKYGNLTIKKVKNNYICECECICGNKCERRLSSLTNLSTCQECYNGIKYLDFVGEKLGYLIIKDYKNKRFICDCTLCGKKDVKKIPTTVINNGGVTCNCLSSKKFQIMQKAKVLKNIHFNKLQYIKTSDNNIGGLRYICKCDCGNEIEVLESDLFTGKVTCCEECRE